MWWVLASTRCPRYLFTNAEKPMMNSEMDRSKVMNWHKLATKYLYSGKACWKTVWHTNSYQVSRVKNRGVIFNRSGHFFSTAIAYVFSQRQHIPCYPHTWLFGACCLKVAVRASPWSLPSLCPFSWGSSPSELGLSHDDFCRTGRKTRVSMHSRKKTVSIIPDSTHTDVLKNNIYYL